MHLVVTAKGLVRRRMPVSVRLAQVLLALHGLILSLPLALLYAVIWLTHPALNGGVAGIAVPATIVFPFGLVLLGTGLTGFPYWRISRWLAYVVEIGFAGALIWLALAVDVDWLGKILVALPLGLIPATLSIFLLSRPSADAWFGQL
jgi:hypothetical protein